MSRVHRRGVVARPSGAPLKTYSEFVAKVTADATAGTRAWDATTTIAAGNYITVCAAQTGVLTGSPWLSVFFGAGAATPAMCRIAQHSFPSQAVFNAQIAAARTVYAQIDTGSAPSGYAALNRNGYLSLSSASTGSPRVVSIFRYYDDTLGPMEMNPSTGTGPTPFTW